MHTDAYIHMFVYVDGEDEGSQGERHLKTLFNNDDNTCPRSPPPSPCSEQNCSSEVVIGHSCMEDTSADATGGPASVNSSSRARSGCGSGSSGEPSMTPTDRPSPAVPELDGAADVAVVDDEDGDGGGERNSDGGGERDGDSGSGSGGGGGGSSEALAVPGSPLVGSSGDRDKPADHSFLDLPPRKRSRNTSYSGRFENGKRKASACASEVELE